MKAQASAKPTTAWNACGAICSGSEMPTSIQNSEKQAAVIASQRHNRTRANAYAAAVTTAR